MTAHYLLEWAEFVGVMILLIIGCTILYILLCVLCSLAMHKEGNDDCMTYEHYNPDDEFDQQERFKL
jgi:putative Mn2+ efflux pump MntP